MKDGSTGGFLNPFLNPFKCRLQHRRAVAAALQHRLGIVLLTHVPKQMLVVCCGWDVGVGLSSSLLGLFFCHQSVGSCTFTE